MHCYPFANVQVQLFIVFCLSFSSWRDFFFFFSFLHHCDPSYSCASYSPIGLLGSAMGCPAIWELYVVSTWMPQTQWNLCQHIPYPKLLIPPFAKFEGTKLSGSNCPECQSTFLLHFMIKKKHTKKVFKMQISVSLMASLKVRLSWDRDKYSGPY